MMNLEIAKLLNTEIIYNDPNFYKFMHFNEDK